MTREVLIMAPQPDERWHAVASPILTEDMPAWLDFHLEPIFGENLPPDKLKEIHSLAHGYFERYINIVQQAFPGEVIALSQEEIDIGYKKRIELALETDPNAIVIMNDRYICRGIEEEHPYNIFRFSSTRIIGNFDNDKGDQQSSVQPRPGDPSFKAQIQHINDKLGEQNRSLEGARVIIADDVATSNGTIIEVADIFTSLANAQVDIPATILNYKIHIGRFDPVKHFDNASGFVERLAVITAEERELYPTGGTTFEVAQEIRKGNIAFQQPAQYPWGDGKMIRTDGFIHQHHLDVLQLEVFGEMLRKTEAVLKGTKRKDGTVFDFFTLKDFRFEIPMGPKKEYGLFFGPSALIRDLSDDRRAAGNGLHELSFVRYIELALEKLRELELPPITHVVEDINGTQREMLYFDDRKRGFRYSQLGEKVDAATAALIEEYNSSVSQENHLHHDPAISSTDVLRDNSDFTKFLEQRYGEQILDKLRTRFKSFYGKEQGSQEFKSYLADAGKNGLTLAYHILREITWGNIDFDEVYAEDFHEARNFNQEAIQKGATIIFVTYSPRIHAMQLLEATGQNKLVISGKAVLITIEDLFDDKGRKQKKKLVYQALSGYPVPEDPSEKSVFDRLQAKLQGNKALHPSFILGVGSMTHSDVRPAIATGGKGFVLNGPDDLNALSTYAEFIDTDTLRKRLTKSNPEAKTSDVIFDHDDDDAKRYKQVILGMDNIG